MRRILFKYTSRMLSLRYAALSVITQQSNKHLFSKPRALVYCYRRSQYYEQSLISFQKLLCHGTARKRRTAYVSAHPYSMFKQTSRSEHIPNQHSCEQMTKSIRVKIPMNPPYLSVSYPLTSLCQPGDLPISFLHPTPSVINGNF